MQEMKTNIETNRKIRKKTQKDIRMIEQQMNKLINSLTLN